MVEKNKDIKRFFKHSYIYAIGNIINRLGAFVLLPVYTNYLSVEEYGIIELFYIISSVVFGFLSMGIAHATLRFYFDYDDTKERHQVVSTNYVFSLVLSIVTVSVISLWYQDISILVFSSADYSFGVILILGTIVFELSSQICLAYVRAIEKSLFFVYIAIAKLLIQVVINIYLVIFLELGVIGVLFGNFMAVFVGWVILSVFTLRKCGVSTSIEKLIPILKYSFPFLLGTVTELVASTVGKFSLNYMESIAAVGIFMLAIKFSMIIEQLIGEPFSRSYGSFRFSIMKQDNAAELQANIVRYLMYGVLFCALAISLYIEELLMIMSNESFWVTANIVPIVMIASIIKVINYPLQTGILFAKKTKYFFYISIVGAVVSITTNLSLIPFYGIYGACIALILTVLVNTVIMHFISQKYFYVKYEYMKLFLACAIAVTLYLASLMIEGPSIIISLALKSLFLLLFVLSLFYSKYFLREDEVENVRQFVSKKIFKKQQ